MLVRTLPPTILHKNKHCCRYPAPSTPRHAPRVHVTMPLPAGSRYSCMYSNQQTPVVVGDAPPASIPTPQPQQWKPNHSDVQRCGETLMTPPPLNRPHNVMLPQRNCFQIKLILQEFIAQCHESTSEPVL